MNEATLLLLSRYTRNELLRQRYYAGTYARTFRGMIPWERRVMNINKAITELDRIHNG